MLGVVVGRDFVVDEESLGSVDELKVAYDTSLGNTIGN
jgi:hypothetical protein